MSQLNMAHKYQRNLVILNIYMNTCNTDWEIWLDI